LRVDYVIGLGANLGSRRASLEAAIAMLEKVGSVTRVSALYESEPVGPPQPRYLNAAVRIASALTPHALLAQLLAIEALLGRTRSATERWTARTLDLDVLWAEQPVHSATLSIPHPRLDERWFALAPLLDVAPELEPEYAAALRAQGGRGPRYAEQLAPGPRAAASGSELCASALDPADAIADVLAALGRRLAAADACGTSAAQVVLLEAEVARASFAPLAAAALDQAARGFAWTHASVSAIDPGRVSARLLGASTSSPARTPVLLDAELTRDGDTHRARIRLGG
jgi:2-amino-4-hydroxy-6-hydroxymethyldihydropteridine diphosphokinase